MKVKEKETFGELLTPRQVKRYISGSGNGKESALGIKRVRHLMSNGVIPSMSMNGRRISRRRDVDKFLDDIGEHGNEELRIDVPKRPNKK